MPEDVNVVKQSKFIVSDLDVTIFAGKSGDYRFETLRFATFFH